VSFELVYDAIKWIFSGIGVVILGAIVKRMFSKKNYNKDAIKDDYKTQIGGSNSNIMTWTFFEVVGMTSFKRKNSV
jgi:hypothetical protein